MQCNLESLECGFDQMDGDSLPQSFFVFGICTVFLVFRVIRLDRFGFAVGSRGRKHSMS